MKFKYSEKHDLIKNIYEGGFKVWECTIDMLNYLDKKIKYIIFIAITNFQILYNK